MAKQLTIAANPDLVSRIADIIAAYAEEYPHVAISIVPEPCSGRMLDALKDRKMSIAIVTLPIDRTDDLLEEHGADGSDTKRRFRLCILGREDELEGRSTIAVGELDKRALIAYKVGFLGDALGHLRDSKANDRPLEIKEVSDEIKLHSHIATRKVWGLWICLPKRKTAPQRGPGPRLVSIPLDPPTEFAVYVAIRKDLKEDEEAIELYHRVLAAVERTSYSVDLSRDDGLLLESWQSRIEMSQEEFTSRAVGLYDLVLEQLSQDNVLTSTSFKERRSYPIELHLDKCTVELLTSRAHQNRLDNDAQPVAALAASHAS